MPKIFFVLSFLFFSNLIYAQQTVGLFEYDSLAYEGYTLFAPTNSTTTYLIDNCGNVVHTWVGDGTAPAESVYLLENGNLLKTGKIDGDFNGGGVGGRISIFDWNGGFVWTYEYASSDFHHHHDVAPLPNGNILLIAWERQKETDAIAAGRNPALNMSDVWSERIVEIKPIGSSEAEIVWEWHLWDHLIQEYDSTKANFDIIKDHPELLDINYGAANQDWIHFNGIDYNPMLDQILLTSRNLSEIYIIDHSTTTAEAASHSGGNCDKGGDFLYRWGNPQVYNRGTEQDQKLFGPHNGTWIKEGFPDENKIMIFNNGYKMPGDDYSTVDVIVPPIDNLDNSYSIYIDEPYKPFELFWTYQSDPVESLYSPTRSGAQRLPNGNTLITEGRRGNFYEVTYDGELVWHYRNPIGLGGPVSQGGSLVNPDVFRSTRYGLGYPAFIGKDLTPGDPIELDPYPSDCEIFGSTVATSDFKKIEGVEILQNPIQDFLIVKNETKEILAIEIFDLMGRKIGDRIESSDDTIEIISDNWKNGIYIIQLFIEGKNTYSLEKVFKYSEN